MIRRPIPLLLVLALALPLVAGGSMEDPEITDPPNDPTVSDGGDLQPILDAAGESDSFADVDLLRAWIDQDRVDDVGEPSPPLHFTVQAAGAVEDGTHTWINFTVDRGPLSVFNSTADGTAWSLHVVGTTVQDGPDNATAGPAPGAEDAIQVSLHTIDVGASGGDVIRNFTVERSRSTDSLAPLVDPGQRAHDRAPDEGAGRAFTLGRPPVVPHVSLALPEGPVYNASGPDADLSFPLTVTNRGTDLDTVALTAASPPEALATFDRNGLELAPGENTTVTVTVQLDGAADDTGVTLSATSGRGGFATLPVTIQVDGPAPPPGNGGEAPGGDRAPAVAGLDWLTPLAEGTGADEAFGEHAETVWLALLVLAAVLLLILLLALTGRSEPSLRERPATYDERRGPGVPLVAADEPLPPDLELLDVIHEPDAPRPGDEVWTAAVIRNNGHTHRKVRAVLVVDGVARQDETLDVHARRRVRVRFPWTAGHGENRVKVQVFEA